MNTETTKTQDRIDVVICTRNREASIEAAVRGVLANDHPDFTLTIIDQSTSDKTGSALRTLIDTDDRLRYVHVEEAGLSRAYNTGIALTSADVLAFTDDDCVVPIDWISRIGAAFRAEPDGDLLYGQVVPLETGEQSNLTPYFAIPHPEKLSKKTRFRVCGMGANFAARRRLFDSIGGFDVVLGGGGPLRSSQDFDLAYRAFRGDAVILLRPEVTLHHDGRRELEDWPTLLVNYGTGDGAFYTKHVRCGDPLAAWFMTKRVARIAASSCVRLARRRDSNGFFYVKGVFAGIRGSFGFKVDRNKRMYLENGAPTS